MHPVQTREWEEFKKSTGVETSRVKGFLITWHGVSFLPWKVGYLGKSGLPTLPQIREIESEAKKKNAILVRLEPDATKPEAKRWLQAYREILRPGRHYFTPDTFWLYLDLTEEELLARMHPKARYNIRLAQKNGVTVAQDNSPAALEKFLELMFAETSARHKFYARNKDYYRKMFAIMQPAGIARLFVARHQGETLAAWILFICGDRLYYPYGASSTKHKEVQAPSLMLWETARWGKLQGCAIYDLWGAEEGKGFNSFKQRFGPKLVEFVGTWDVVVNPWLYWLYRVAERLRWKILRLLK